MKVTVLGTGTMGAPMAANLSRGGLDTTVWDRTPAKAERLADAGARVAATPAEAVAEADAVITMLPDADALVSVLVHKGVLDALPPGAVWAQMGTIGIDATDRFAALARERRPDVSFVDAPVSGSKGPAEAGKLIVLASGPPAVETSLAPVFAALGQRTLWVGEAGRGTRLKLVLYAWLACLMEGVGETLTLADDLGVAHSEVLDALDGNAVAAPAAIAKIRKLDKGDYEPEFALEWALKDVELARTAAHENLPALEAIAQQWRRAAERYGRLDVSAARLALGSDEQVRSV
jgi:3-hydroxyisobutyrate dehydrogenase